MVATTARCVCVPLLKMGYSRRVTQCAACPPWQYSFQLADVAHHYTLCGKSAVAKCLATGIRTLRLWVSSTTDIEKHLPCFADQPVPHHPKQRAHATTAPLHLASGSSPSSYCLVCSIFPCAATSENCIDSLFAHTQSASRSAYLAHRHYGRHHDSISHTRCPRSCFCPSDFVFSRTDPTKLTCQTMGKQPPVPALPLKDTPPKTHSTQTKKVAPVALKPKRV